MVIGLQSVNIEMTPSPEQQTTTKSTLYCPDCSHESRINGDWTISALSDLTTYECPDCGALIDSRRNRKALTAGSGGALRFSADD
jgi:predicted RNA-binding Zn-ribbon protein involved in translation (DUF1610 family)